MGIDKDNDAPFGKRKFLPDHCFVCDEFLTNESRTEEHIYPKWLQRKFNLYNQELILLNGSKIKYRNLKVPCCKNCNEEMSKRIEKPIERALDGGYDEFVKLDKTVIFQWLNKLSYGILYKELSLKMDQKKSDSKTIVKEEWIQELHMKYMFLKSIIHGTQFHQSPASILIFKISYNPSRPYWGYDGFGVPVFFICMNDIGIMAHLQDNQYNEEFFKEKQNMNELLSYELHPIQFREVCARFMYKSSLFIRNPFYIIQMDQDENPQHIISQEINGIGYDDWSQSEYAKYLTYFLEPWKVSYEDLYKGNDLVMNFLRNEDGSFKKIEE